MDEENVVEKLLEELKQKISEIEEIYSTLQTLKKYGAEVTIPDLSSLLGKERLGTTLRPSLEIQPGEFYNLSNTEATEKYLRKVGHAMPLEDIYSALVEGGVRFVGDGKKNLNIQLTRATRKFAKIGQGRGVSFGLLEWYPKRRRLIRVEDSGASNEELEKLEEIILKEVKGEKKE